MLVRIDDIIKMIPDGINTIEEIPQGNWLVKITDRGEYYLEKQPDFKLPNKMYGNVEEQADRYITAFMQRGTNLGVLLRGLKGTGKSLTSKAICVRSGLPVLFLTQPHRGIEFESFLAKITQPVIIFIDEFEKIYNSDSEDDRDGLHTDNRSKQSNLLSILDGIYQGKKMFLLTANNEGSIDDALMNRPGRIRYFKQYGGLSKEVIVEVVDDLLIYDWYREELVELATMLNEINMDMLIALIEEVNMFNESPKKLANDLNIQPARLDYEVHWTETVEKSNRKGDVKEVKANLKSTVRADLLTEDSIVLHYYDDEVGHGAKRLPTTNKRYVEGGIIIEHDDNTYFLVKEEKLKYVF